MTIQNKITLLFTALTATIILSLNFFIYVFASRQTFQIFYLHLETRSQIAAYNLLGGEEKSVTFQNAHQEYLTDLPDERHHIVKTNTEGRPIDNLPNLPLPEGFYEELQTTGSARYNVDDFFFVGFAYDEVDEPFFIISSAVDMHVQEELSSLRNLLVGGSLVGILIVFSVARVFSSQIFKPVRDIIRKVRGISAHNLSERLEGRNGKDEISDLANTFNEMLDRLQITFEMQNNFISNASHEFKTPLTIIAGEAELGITHPEAPQPSKHSFDVILRESEKLEHLISSLLAMAQTGFDGKKEKWEEIRIDELIFSIKETIDYIFPDNQLEIDFDTLPQDNEELCVEGNPVLLRTAVLNIVLNACKYSNSREVLVRVSSDQKRIIIEVTDHGIGIPTKELPQIFVPFFRASNTATYKGHGVGLPLANNIIRMHHGHTNVKSEEGKGTTVVVYLPHRSVPNAER